MLDQGVNEIRLLPSLEEDDMVCFTFSNHLRFKFASGFFRFIRFALRDGEVFYKTQRIVIEIIEDECEDWIPIKVLEEGAKNKEIDPDFFGLYDIWCWIEKNVDVWKNIPEYVDKASEERKAFIAKVQKMIGACKSENANLNRTLSDANSILEKTRNRNETLKKEYASLRSTEQKELEESIQQAKSEIEGLKEIITQIDTYKDELNSITPRNELAKKELVELQNELERLQTEVDNLLHTQESYALFQLLFENEKDSLPIEFSEKIKRFL